MNRGFVVAVCTSRLDELEKRGEHNRGLVGDGEFLVLLDAACEVGDGDPTARLRDRGAEVICHGARLGLSAARNSVLDARPDYCVLFIDDDVWLRPETIRNARAAFAGGAGVVGAPLVPPQAGRPWPWFFTTGQMHLAGWHPRVGQVKTWGAFMGVDSRFAHRHGLRFDPRLGRTGRRLESGDDTSFVTAMKQAGAREELIGTPAIHDVNTHRLTLRYLTRREYWQGRSEVRRRQPMVGLGKEWCRHRSGQRVALLATWYILAFAAGMLHEWLASPLCWARVRVSTTGHDSEDCRDLRGRAERVRVER